MYCGSWAWGKGSHGKRLSDRGLKVISSQTALGWGIWQGVFFWQKHFPSAVFTSSAHSHHGSVIELIHLRPNLLQLLDTEHWPTMNLLCWFKFFRERVDRFSFRCQDHVPAVWSTLTFSEIPYHLQLPENKHKLFILHLEMQLHVHAWSASNPRG